MISLVVANESNSDYTSHGPDLYLIARGETQKECLKQAYDYLCGMYYYFEYDMRTGDYEPFLQKGSLSDDYDLREPYEEVMKTGVALLSDSAVTDLASIMDVA